MDKYIRFQEVFTLRWKDAKTGENAFTRWQDFGNNLQLWIDLQDWLWKTGILKYGNFFYRLVFCNGMSKHVFWLREDYYKLSARVSELERR